MTEKYQQLIADYLQGSLDEATQQEIELLIESGAIDYIELKAMEQLHNELDILPEPQPDPQLRRRFYTMLEQQQQQQQITPTPSIISIWMKRANAAITLPRLAYTFIVLLIGFLSGNLFSPNSKQLSKLSEELVSLRQIMMVSMLEGPTTTDRLRAVSISSSLPKVDQSAIRALLFTLNNDPNDNVRLQAVEALVRWGGNPMVREGLVKSIVRQESDIVIAELADVMVQLGLKNSVGEFEKLVNQRELNALTREKINNTIEVLI